MASVPFVVFWINTTVTDGSKGTIGCRGNQVIFQLAHRGKLKVVGGYYELDTGIVSLVN
jgi:hypothetical protein